MSFEFEVDGTVDLGSGYRLVAGGYRGRGVATEPSDYTAGATRSSTTQQVLSDVLAGALDRAEMREEQAIELMLVPEPGGQPSRSARQEDAVVLETPDLGEHRGQVVMLTDEDGGVSFHYPVESEKSLEVQPPTVRGAGGTKVFVIPAEVTPGEPSAEAETRSLIGVVGRKLIQVLSFPVARAVGARVGEPLVRRWELANRPYGIRWYGPADFRHRDGRKIDDWSPLDGNRSLLFIHGTFATSPGGFGGIPATVMEGLQDRYGGRVLAFDHPSLSADPVENVSWFIEQVPGGVHLDLDVIAHSRGGLVARVLAGGKPDAGLDLSNITVHSVVCAGTPNYGTPLADAQHLSSLCDRLATATNLIPGLPVGEMIDVVLLLVQVVAQAVLEGLSGLEVMSPQSDFLDSINTTPGTGTRYFGVAANYQPNQRGMKRVVEGLKDGAIDYVFRGAQNDLVVPTLGVYKGDHPFAIEPSHLISFDASRGVMHSTFWKEPEVEQGLADWLSA
ncbi:MAG TPA: alpha/beta hydrolase [Acidimicrobiia bacterium]|nr:alpha/beta hydrolase [Acidimicrobiia bacterium]